MSNSREDRIIKLDYNQIIYEVTGSKNHTFSETLKECMKKACQKTLDEAIKSFPSHEHPEITKSINKLKEKL